MTNLRCTAKLLRRFGVPNPPDPPPGTNALGDWTADLIAVPGAHLVLCVSERGRLPVVVSARRLYDFPSQFPRLVRDVLGALGVPAEAAEPECMRMATLAYGPTRDRSVLGTLNDFSRMLKSSWMDQPDLSIFDWSLWLAETPCGPLEMRSPRDVVPELLVPSGKLWVLEGNPPLAEAGSATEALGNAAGQVPRRTLTEFERARIDRLFMAYRDRRIPPRHRGTITLVWDFRERTVTLVELRPRLMVPDEWAELKVAQFRRDDEGLWSLYCRDRNGRWHRYRPVPPSRDVEDLLREVDADPTGIFWG
jgi:hypothetical protein